MDDEFSKARSAVDVWDRAYRENPARWWVVGPESLREALETCSALEADDPRRIGLLGTIDRLWNERTQEVLDNGSATPAQTGCLYNSLLVLVENRCFENR
jgi:hypothetical protein